MSTAKKIEVFSESIRALGFAMDLAAREWVNKESGLRIEYQGGMNFRLYDPATQKAVLFGTRKRDPQAQIDDAVARLAEAMQSF